MPTIEERVAKLEQSFNKLKDNLQEFKDKLQEFKDKLHKEAAEQAQAEENAKHKKRRR